MVRGYDVFWYHALGPAVTMPLVKLFRKKIISTVHGLDWKRDKFGKLASAVLKYGEKCIAKCADRIITLQRYDQQYFKEKWGRETDLIPNGVRAAELRAADLITSKYGISKGEYFLFMSRIVPEKGLHTLIEAYNKLDTNKKLVIAGKGVHTSDYEKRIRQLSSGNKNIIFTGMVDGEIKSELYSNAYAYILPSTIEGQSIGLLEAMSYGLPCIVSDIPENADVVNKNAGFIFRSGDVNSLVNVLMRVDKNSDEVLEIGNHAQALVNRKYDLDNTIKETAMIIQEVLVR
ncbi:MAG: glycosyltransferase family 4 protein [Clostridiales bacterium]|nr:glycosyltransferase family 4 protein [Clostridiales bacterium]